MSTSRDAGWVEAETFEGPVTFEAHGPAVRIECPVLVGPSAKISRVELDGLGTE